MIYSLLLVPFIVPTIVYLVLAYIYINPVTIDRHYFLFSVINIIASLIIFISIIVLFLEFAVGL